MPQASTSEPQNRTSKACWTRWFLRATKNWSLLALMKLWSTQLAQHVRMVLHGTTSTLSQSWVGLCPDPAQRLSMTTISTEFTPYTQSTCLRLTVTAQRHQQLVLWTPSLFPKTSTKSKIKLTPATTQSQLLKWRPSSALAKKSKCTEATNSQTSKLLMKSATAALTSTMPQSNGLPSILASKLNRIMKSSVLSWLLVMI